MHVCKTRVYTEMFSANLFLRKFEQLFHLWSTTKMTDDEEEWEERKKKKKNGEEEAEEAEEEEEEERCLVLV